MYKFYIFFVLCNAILAFSFNKDNRIKLVDDSDYNAIYLESIELLDKNKLELYVKSLYKIISNSKNNLLVMNCYYDLGQIYLSRYNDFYLALEQFEYIFNNSFSYNSKSINLDIKNYLELKEKSLFMIAYICHNHIGNLSKSKKYYTLFLDKYPRNDLSSSVNYELDIIDRKLKKINKD